MTFGLEDFKVDEDNMVKSPKASSGSRKTKQTPE